MTSPPSIGPSSRTSTRESGGDPGPDPEVAAAAIRDAIAAMERERPDLAERLRELLARVERK